MPPQGPQRLRWEDVGDVTVVRLEEAPFRNPDSTRSLFETLTAFVQDAGRRLLVLNLGGVRGLDSHAIGKLIQLDRTVQAVRGRLALCDLTPTLGEAFDTLHLRRVLDVYDGERSAVQALRLFEREVVGKVVVLRVRARSLDEAEAGLLAEELRRLAAQAERRSFVLNFRAVETVTAAAVGALTRLAAEVGRGTGDRLGVCHLRPDLQDRLGAAPLAVHATEQQALDAI